ncbi:Hypothetical protein I595_1535 [Croceitalea dokdonensis DOKDO 023]|uniref:Uncharacterized protein n=1 Tax=Croceitalea dokdonensis DOKDO 023 TaxID=1300341 RepID=A0A0P7AJA7_9FLAO|nr:Hypothetical protein I595_1535 [Croceitalea dokdonensis DOKDO 023]
MALVLALPVPNTANLALLCLPGNEDRAVPAQLRKKGVRLPKWRPLH